MQVVVAASDPVFNTINGINMLETTLQLIDRLIAFLQQRQNSRRNIFDDHIEPIYRQMAQVHQEYQRTLRYAKRRVSRASMQKTRQLLEDKRRDLEHIRKEIHAVGREFSKGGHAGLPDVAHGFHQCCLDYFCAQAAEQGDQYTGYYTLLLESDFDNRARFISKLDAVLAYSEHAWNNLSTAYARARLELLR